MVEGGCWGGSLLPTMVLSENQISLWDKESCGEMTAYSGECQLGRSGRRTGAME